MTSQGAKQTPSTSSKPISGGMEEQPDGTVHFEEALKYEPQVGDVVEFELKSTGGIYQGIVFLDYGPHNGVAFKLDGKGDYNGYDWTRISRCENVRKIGHIQHDGNSINDAKRTAKAYFSTPTFTGSYKERQKQWIEHHGLKVGDKVKVVRKFKDNEDGYYGSSRDHTVGKTGSIQFINRSGGFFVDGDVDTFIPYFALKSVKE